MRLRLSPLLAAVVVSGWSAVPAPDVEPDSARGPSSTAGAPASDVGPARGLSIAADCGVLSVTPIAAGAVRVRCAPGSTRDTPSLVLIHPAASVPAAPG